MDARKKNTLDMIVHILTSFVLLAKGIDKVSHHHELIGITFILFSLLIALLTFLSQRHKVDHQTTKVVSYFCESIAIGLMAYVFYMEQRVYLPYVMGAAAVGFMVGAIVTLSQKSSYHKT